MASFNILSVEDQELLRTTLRIFLTSQGFSVTTAIHGQDALDKLKEGCDPDVLLVDNNMPVMDGITFIKKIKKELKYMWLPVVFLSANNESDRIIEAIRCGAIDYITKPYEADDLLKRLKRAYQIGKQLRLAQTLDSKYNSLKSNWDDIAELPYMELHLTHITEIQAVARFLTSSLPKVYYSQITVGLLEGLSNAIIHGNYELSSQIKEKKDGFSLMQKEIKKREVLPKYKDRKVIITRQIYSNEVEYIITDEGSGFDISTIMDPRMPANVVKKTGRGLLLMQVYFDEVEYNSVGNVIKLTKKI